MCGIAGFVGANVSSALPLTTLAHRGPDDSGWIAHPPHAATGPLHSLLLHRRLSILDLSSAGRQPMASADGTFTLVFNGEIYNYRELREELQSAGCDFRTQTDTEVLLHAYMQWGKRCLTRFIGMFAFAVEDKRRGLLFLARDCFGIKPLYYAQTAHGFAFASEIKALLDWLPIPRTADPHRVYDYLRHGRTDDGTSTMWSAIRQVPAAHYLEAPLDGRPPGDPVRYWDLPRAEPIDISFGEAARRVRDVFLDNIQLHLRSDVPVGAALSGGIDSSAIVAAMRVVAPNADLHAFSYIADDPAVSEETWVDLIGTYARARVHKVRPRPDDLVADLDRLVYMQDEPFGSTSIYAQYRVFSLARSLGVKVMLDGQGADELLAGYRHFIPARLASLIAQGRLAEAWRFARASSRLPGMRGRWRLWLQAARAFAPNLAERLLLPAWLNAGWFRQRGVSFTSSIEPASSHRLLDELRRSISATSLPMLLRYEDRNSMAASIESRVPFLTPALADFVLRLPESYLLGDDGTSKNVFRAALRGIVPDAILDRRDKIGFATPEQRWLAQLRPWVEATLQSERARSMPMLHLPAIERDWSAVLAGRRRFDFRIWRWVNLIRWADRFDVTFA